MKNKNLTGKIKRNTSTVIIEMIVKILIVITIGKKVKVIVSIEEITAFPVKKENAINKSQEMNLKDEETLQAANVATNIIVIKKKNTLNTEKTLIITKEMAVRKPNKMIIVKKIWDLICYYIRIVLRKYRKVKD